MQNDIPANTHNDIDAKTLVETSFYALMHEVEEHITYGWRIHPEYAPVANIMGYYEVMLYKDRASINRVRNRIDSVLGARAEETKEKQSANVRKAGEVTKQRTQERKGGKVAQAMQASLEGTKDEG